jgi:hypothetical protein
MARFALSPALATEAMIRAYRLIGSGDAVNYGTFYPYWLCFIYGARVRVPGLDLPENEIWQVDEAELMRREDYDRVLALGWPEYFKEHLEERVLGHLSPERRPGAQARVDARSLWAEEGVPVLSGGDVTTPFELLCGARSFQAFARDLYEIPGKVEAVMEAVSPHLAAGPCRRAKKLGYPGVWVGGWRAAPSMLSPRMWDRFVWPYFQRLVREVADAGLIAILHLDSSWDRELARFRQLPRARCILATDGETDLYRAKEILGDHMCLMGDLPASMQCLSDPDEVFQYCRRLIEDLGPGGFILQSGCDIAPNARIENVRAMVQAATGG